MSKFLDLEGLGYYTQCFKPGLAEVIDSGAKNELNINLDSLKQLNPGSWTDNTRTVDNTAFTVNSDGSITVNSVGGVAPTTNRFFLLTDTLNDVLENGKEYVLSGTTGGSVYSYGIYAGTGGVWDNYDGGAEKIYNSTITSIYIFVIAGTVMSDVTFKPMICTKSAWNISQTYQPYRPSYQELYDMVKALQ